MGSLVPREILLGDARELGSGKLGQAVAVEPKFEDAAAGLSAKSGATDARTVRLQDLERGGADQLTGRINQFFGQPAADGGIALGVHVPLELETGRH